jgi:GT2 family glycosyltransferase
LSLRLGIVIVHYNTPDDLARLLESLRSETTSCPHEVVVVDNASTTPGLEGLQEQFKEVRWLRNAENVGYGRGCNQGMAALPADYHLILNPDIVVLPGSLAALLAFADRHPRAGLIGPQLLNEDGTIQESCRRFYTLKTLLLRRTVLGRIFPRSETVRRHLMRDFDHTEVRPVDWVLGGCILVRREARQSCGPMDERFFLYFEDVDWCYRMWQCGFEVLYLPDARFVHRHRRASAQGRFSRSFWLHLGSLISFYEKWSLLIYAAKKWRRPVTIALHWMLDMGLLAVSLLGAYGLRFLLQPFFTEDLLPLSWYRVWLVYAGILVTVAFVLMGRYRSSHLRSKVGLAEHTKQMGLVALLLLAGSYLGREDVVSRAVLILLLVLYTGLTIWAARMIRRLNRRLEAGYFALERTLLAGPVEELERWLAGSGNLHFDGIDLVGYVTDDQNPSTGHAALGAGRVPWLGSIAVLPQVVDRLRVSQVAFWHHPGRHGSMATILAHLRRMRIRLRWVLDEAWLLSTGARAESFGAASSGVLDPDDGGTLRRLAMRPIEVTFAMVLLFISGILRRVRRSRLSKGTIRLVRLDTSTSSDDPDAMAIYTDEAGKPMPLWWQSTLLRGLLVGRIRLWGRPLAVPCGQDRAHHGPGADGSLSWLEGGAFRQAALTGPWPGENRVGGGGILRPLRRLFLAPCGWTPVEETNQVDTRRDGGPEVDQS